MIPKPTILIILDGWGVAPDSSGNAITSGDPKYYNSLVRDYPTTLLQASGEAVGLSWGDIGNSEVGHLNIGAGKIVYQNLMRISKSIEDGNFYKNKILLDSFKHAKKNKSKMHFIGLVSDGGIHSYMGHLYGLLELARQQNVSEVYIHAILDGRDTRYNEGVNLVSRLINRMNNIKVGRIASITGRFFAMDRDNHWNRIEKAYSAMANGVADSYFSDPLDAIESSYKKEIYDEEFRSAVIVDSNKKPITKIEEDDSVVFFNFRPDRARELTKSFVLPSFDKFDRKYIKNLSFATLTEYEKKLPVNVVFPKEEIESPLAKIISSKGMKQLHIAETEKYAHITYFLNGGNEDPYPGEDNVIVPSPRSSSYLKTPEMSSGLISKRVVDEIMKDKYDFIAINFANADMIGHTGNMKAAIKAVKSIDNAIKDIVELALLKDGCVVITSDHGNAEDMINERIGEMEKEHTNNPVPFIVVKKDYKSKNVGVMSPVKGEISGIRPSGILADVSPTILKIMGIRKPKDMQGISLV